MVQQLAQEILQNAADFGVSDVYFLPSPIGFSVIFRNSDSRETFREVSDSEGQSLISHFKFTAGMNVGEKRRPQLGSCLYEFSDKKLRLRLSSAGDFESRESLVIRLLHDSDKPLSFWFDEDLSAVKKLVTRRGLYLFSGPVGSGKTTLMHHIAKAKFAGKQVITIEDPVEIVAPDLLQFQLNEAIGNTYDSLIKLSLRHMPDLVIVGEIRDSETARAVMRASLTGYTVFSTIHAKSISGVYARLLELGIAKEEISNSLSGIVYQRLIARKGVLDIAERNFATYTNKKWNSKIEKLATTGHISPIEAKTEKITDKKTSQTH
ncbi:competence protein CglA [Lactococcus hodotermopsidis]|uniref:Competence protein CglA n=1 Tax=Pseudolactococcus hodotermopsidis TaxID=2709157 RepID=A0A6A0BDB4_9LACT|nr:competence type IV pilus ATPase ComGA [Lactococcus hodotermopsidis]GFH42454.1 competence protein CglA [Lactococcus hodotermopsidis]